MPVWEFHLAYVTHWIDELRRGYSATCMWLERRYRMLHSESAAYYECFFRAGMLDKPSLKKSKHGSTLRLHWWNSIRWFRRYVWKDSLWVIASSVYVCVSCLIILFNITSSARSIIFSLEYLWHYWESLQSHWASCLVWLITMLSPRLPYTGVMEASWRKKAPIFS